MESYIIYNIQCFCKLDPEKQIIMRLLKSCIYWLDSIVSYYAYVANEILLPQPPTRKEYEIFNLIEQVLKIVYVAPS